jgi:hypothetical protein
MILRGLAMSQAEKPIRAKCPGCGSVFLIEPTLRGRQMPCVNPVCGKILVIEGPPYDFGATNIGNGFDSPIPGGDGPDNKKPE